jgi:phage major head subunit gpT-like protein
MTNTNNADSQMQAWHVILGSRVLDTVFYQARCDAQYVKQTLVEHDGYSPAIRVKRARQ